MRTGKLKLRATALAILALPLVVSQALAAEYFLRAQATTVSMPDPGGSATPVSIDMWGYASCNNDYSTCSAVTVPGPKLIVPAGDTQLIVHLQNKLDRPTSLVINGLTKPMVPVWDTGVTGNRPNPTARVRSFDAEAPANGTADYTWNNVKPGTYLYQSGTQPQVQVQMGLYGAATKNAVDIVVGTSLISAVRGQAYAGATNTFDNEAMLFYSEIDPALHAAVAGGTYGTASGPKSTFDYQPKYFLVNGQPYSFGTPAIEPLPAGNPGTTLLRVLNAGLTTHVPMIQGKLWDIVAEDGKAYPYKRTQYTALLPAAKTLDMLLEPVLGGGSLPIIDRRLSLSNAGLPDVGGMLAFLKFGAMTTPLPGGGATSTNSPPTVVDHGYATIAGVPLDVPAIGLLDGATDTDSPTIKAVAASGSTSGLGTYVLNANGAFNYTPAAGFSGSDTFTYVVTDGKALSNTGTVTIDVSVPAPASPAQIDDFAAPGGRTALNAVCADCWNYVATSTGGASLVVNAGQAAPPASSGGGRAIFKTEFLATQAASITSSSLADTALILKATGGTLAASPANFIRVSCDAATGKVVIATMTGGSGASSFVTQAAFPAPGCSGSGILTARADSAGVVSVWLGGGFVGGARLPNVGAWTGTGRVGIQLLSETARIGSVNAATVP